LRKREVNAETGAPNGAEFHSIFKCPGKLKKNSVSRWQNRRDNFWIFKDKLIPSICPTLVIVEKDAISMGSYTEFRTCHVLVVNINQKVSMIIKVINIQSKDVRLPRID
jgi:hypothetical protein